jgi:hypothetical protein
VVGRSRQHQLDRLIDEVAHGKRELGSIRDQQLREAVRLALRLHKQTPETPDPYARLRMRARVIAGLRPHGPTLLDNAWTALWLLGRPAPYIVRSVAFAALLAAAGLGATVASADTLPDDLLYPVKIAAEGVRLALAAVPADRAAVELSIAEHRLSEAERLATSGRTLDALVASAMYSQHIASAAAELAPEAETSPLARQLESRFDEQRGRAQTLATTLSTSSKSAAAARILAMIARPTFAPGPTVIQRVADTAVGLSTELARAADDGEREAAVASRSAEDAALTAGALATPSLTIPSSRVVGTASPAAATAQLASSETATPRPQREARETSQPRQTASERATPTERTAEEHVATAAPTTSARATSEAERKASEVAKTVRKALEETKAAADRAKKHK